MNKNLVILVTGNSDRYDLYWQSSLYRFVKPSEWTPEVHTEKDFEIAQRHSRVSFLAVPINPLSSPIHITEEDKETTEVRISDQKLEYERLGTYDKSAKTHQVVDNFLNANKVVEVATKEECEQFVEKMNQQGFISYKVEVLTEQEYRTYNNLPSNTHKVLDTFLYSNNVVMVGTLVECETFVNDQDDIGYKVEPLTEEEIKIHNNSQITN